MRRPNLKQIETFVAVADLGSFSRAATRLGTTQPGISQRIAALEAALGAVLLERDPGSVRLTARGRDLLDPARRVLRAADDLVVASGNPAAFDGVLRLGVTEMVVHTWLGDFLARLAAAYPALAVELTVDLSVTLDRDLAERTLDLAFQSGPFAHPASGSVPLGTYPLTWVAAPSVAAALGPGATLEALLAHPILTHARDTRPYADVEDHVRRAGRKTPRLVPSNNLAACIRMTAQGMGVATLLDAMVAPEIESGRLARLDYAWTPEPLAFFARYDAERAPRFVSLAAGLAGEAAAAFVADGKPALSSA